uniref:Transmembrane protein n=1 Tax=Mesocestoides corti TaxID=53468 RepID=A0A5K3FXJ3_MESCO
MDFNASEPIVTHNYTDLMNRTIQNSTNIMSNKLLFLETKSAQAFAGLMSFAAVLISGHHIYLHLTNYTA